MQKKLIALAVASLVSAPAFAQSSVTIYGTFDAGVRHVDNTNVAGVSKANTTMDSAGTYNSNRWGMKGSENLGNGMKANFNLEGGFMSGTGVGSISGGLFGRKQIVGLSGSWGALDLGRNYTAIFYTTGAYDPFRYKYTGIIPVATLDGARRSNDIQYTGKFNGLTVRLEHALGEVAGLSGASATTEAGASYANGPFSVGLAWGQQKNATDTLYLSKQWTVGGAYKMNPFEIMAGYHILKADVAGGGTNDTKNWWLGGRYALSAANALTLAYYNTKLEAVAAAGDGERKLTMLGFVHNLSKRTELYAGLDHSSLDGTRILTTDLKNKILGVSVGINHAF